MTEEIGSSSKLIIHLPEDVWVGQISRRFPDLNFEFKSAMPIHADSMVCNNFFTIKGIQCEKIIPILKDHQQIVSIRILETKPTEISVMLQSKSHIILYTLLKHEIAPQFPILVQNGKTFLSVVGGRDHIDNFITALDQFHMKVELKQIGKLQTSFVDGLTARQVEIYHKARSAGYYDSPRRITLSELAMREKISKSTLSVTLQRIHKKLLGTEAPCMQPVE